MLRVLDKNIQTESITLQVFRFSFFKIVNEPSLPFFLACGKIVQFISLLSLGEMQSRSGFELGLASLLSTTITIAL